MIDKEDHKVILVVSPALKESFEAEALQKILVTALEAGAEVVFSDDLSVTGAPPIPPALPSLAEFKLIAGPREEVKISSLPFLSAPPRWSNPVPHPGKVSGSQMRRGGDPVLRRNF